MPVAHGAVGSELTLPAAKLLMTVLGDYWFGADEHVPSSVLVALLGEFGIGEDAARAAFSRLCREGRIERSKFGRRTAYRLAAAARTSAAERGRALVAFGAEHGYREDEYVVRARPTCTPTTATGGPSCTGPRSRS